MQTAIKKAFLVLGMVLACASAPGATTTLPAAPLDLHVLGTLTIQVGPQNQTVMAGQSVTFNVLAAGDQPLKYQWTFNGANVGSNTNAYTRSNCQVTDNGGIVQVAVSNPSNSVQSAIATLSVTGGGTLYYVSPNGSSGNTGKSSSSPWSLSYALANAGPNNTILMMDGTYPSIYLGTSSSQSHLTIRALNKWQAKIVGSSGAWGIFVANSVNNVTIDGLQIAYSYIDGVKLDHPSAGDTIRNCWIHHSGQGSASAVQNTDGSYTGQGILAEEGYGNVFENNLIELGGMWINHDHGMYVSGTNCIIRNSVIRGNLTWGVQIYSDSFDSQNFSIYNNLIYNNAKGLNCYSYSGFTNQFWGNTISSLNDSCVKVSDTVFLATNNIIIPSSGNLVFEAASGAVIYADYNMSYEATGPTQGGAHDVITSSYGFVNQSAGLYWLTGSSSAKGHGWSGCVGPVDFFGNVQSSVSDIGAFQYNATLANDSRTLDPSPATGADYWAVP